jgi:hypothetical protein
MSSDMFVNRHIGPRDNDLDHMLKTIGVKSLDELIDRTVPKGIRLEKPLKLPRAMSEYEYLNHLKSIGQKNKIFRSFMGRDIMALLLCLLSSGMSWKILHGIHHILLTRLKFHREDWKLCSTSRQ